MYDKVNIKKSPHPANLEGREFAAPGHSLHGLGMQGIENGHLLNGEGSWYIQASHGLKPPEEKPQSKLLAAGLQAGKTWQAYTFQR